MDVTTLIVAAFVVLALPLIPLTWFFIREIRRSRVLFRTLATRLAGTTTTLPFGVVFELKGVPVRVYALQGSVRYRARIRLREDPNILVTRTYRRFRFLDKLHYSPSRQKFLFHEPVDEQYGFREAGTRAGARWLRTIFDPDLLQRMTTQGRITRIEVRRRGITGGHLLLKHSEAETTRACESIDILNDVVTRVLQSGLVSPDQ